MLLTIDVGNTMTDFGLFSPERETLYYRIRSRRDLTIEEAVASSSLFFRSKDVDSSFIDGAIISSVVPALTEVYRALCSTLFHLEPKILGPKLKTGLRIVTDNPKEVGADMIAAGVAAKQKYGSPCIVVDFGTATKVFLVDSSGSFAGCTIGAGIGLQAASLSSSAALLPEVSLQIPGKILGKNTVDCMNSALTYGNAYAAMALADGIEKEAGYPCKRILTGGFAGNVASLMEGYVYDPHLILEGLSFIYSRNSL